MVSAILEGKPDKNLILVTGRIHPKLAEDVAEQLGIDVLETTAYDFANGEMYVRYTESVRGADVFVLQSHYKPINKAIMEQLIMIDAIEARLGPFHYCGLPVARLLPSGQEAPRPRAHLLPSGVRPAENRRCRPHHVGRSACRAVPRLLRRPGRSSGGHASAGRLHT